MVGQVYTATDDDNHYLHIALEMAKDAYRNNCSPTGAIMLTRDGRIFSERSHRKETCDIGHAEFLLISRNQKLTYGCSVFSIMEPCVMCMGLMIVSGVSRIIWAINDNWGGWNSTIENRNNKYLNSKMPKLIKSDNPFIVSRSLSMWKAYLDLSAARYTDEVLGKQ